MVFYILIALISIIVIVYVVRYSTNKNNKNKLNMPDIIMFSVIFFGLSSLLVTLIMFMIISIPVFDVRDTQSKVTTQELYPVDSQYNLTSRDYFITVNHEGEYTYVIHGKDDSTQPQTVALKDITIFEDEEVSPYVKQTTQRETWEDMSWYMPTFVISAGMGTSASSPENSKIEIHIPAKSVKYYSDSQIIE